MKSRSKSPRSSSGSSIGHSALRRSSFPAGPSSGLVPSEGPSSLSNKHKEALLTFLAIPTELPNLGPPSLHTAYVKYKALISASKPMQGLRANQEWADHLEQHGIDYWVPIYVDLVNIFIAKSQFYSGWKTAFNRAPDYPQMKSWLDNKSDCDSDSEVWGDTKNADDYSFVDLMGWFKKEDAARGRKVTVAKASSSAGKKLVMKEKRKKERKVSSDESEVLSERKKSKSKQKSTK